MPLSPAVASWLAGKGHDAVHAHEAALDRAPDAAILDHARAERRIVITADLDYPRLLALMGAREPGVILFRGGSFKDSDVLDRLQRVLEVVPPEELGTSVIVIERRRIRRRRLPLQADP